jgi:hypothetical protein
MIQECCDKKCDQYDDDTYPEEGEEIEELIIHTLERAVYPVNATKIQYSLNDRCNQKYFFVNSIEYNKKKEIEERKIEHTEPL